MSDLAIVFPGQGAQYVGMGKDLAAANSGCKEIYARAGEVVGFDLAQLCFEGPEEDLKKTTNTQPALLTTCLAVYELVKDICGQPLVMAGHSLGEYTALAASGAFSLETGVELVSKRAKYMTEAVADGIGSMAAILGLAEDKLAAVCSEASGDETVVIANINSPGQIVISGHKGAVERACEAASAAGAKRAIPLAVSGPFHSPLLAPAAQQMKSLLDEKAEADLIGSAAIPVIANCSAEPVSESAQIVEALATQVDNPVRWLTSVQKMQSMGAKRFLEVGPKVLGTMIRKIMPEAEFDNVKDLESLETYKVKLGD
jgi:[acyl-carrier-protein] S-malonyltransferase